MQNHTLLIFLTLFINSAIMCMEKFDSSSTLAPFNPLLPSLYDNLHQLDDRSLTLSPFNPQPHFQKDAAAWLKYNKLVDALFFEEAMDQLNECQRNKKALIGKLFDRPNSR